MPTIEELMLMLPAGYSVIRHKDYWECQVNGRRVSSCPDLRMLLFMEIPVQDVRKQEEQEIKG